MSISMESLEKDEVMELDEAEQGMIPGGGSVGAIKKRDCAKCGKKTLHAFKDGKITCKVCGHEYTH